MLCGTLSAVIFTALTGLPWQRVALLWAVAIAVTEASGRYITSVLGGVIGDCLGAANQLVEVATYLSLVARPLSAVAGQVISEGGILATLLAAVV
jgi:adenosylcobinamide-GDP ribazoletransferase